MLISSHLVRNVYSVRSDKSALQRALLCRSAISFHQNQSCKRCRDRNARLNNCLQEKIVKHIIVDAFTFEVARALDRDLSLRIGLDFSYNSDRQKLISLRLWVQILSPQPNKVLFAALIQKAALQSGFLFVQNRHRVATVVPGISSRRTILNFPNGQARPGRFTLCVALKSSQKNSRSTRSPGHLA